MSDQSPLHARPLKTMSSRLMTMKFMQRAAASTPFLPKSQVRTSDTPESKRQKTSAAPSRTTTSTPDQGLIRFALAEEDEKRERAIERLAEETGETKWVLDAVNGNEGNGEGGLRVTRAGYSDIDRESWRPATIGRRSFGKFNQELEKRQDVEADNSLLSSEASEEKDGEGDDVLVGRKHLYRTVENGPFSRVNDERHQGKQQRSADQAELVRLAGQRRSNQVSLNRLSSTSGVGGGGNPGNSGKSDIECYSCGEKGHAKKDCLNKGKRRNEDWHSGAAKRSRASLGS